VKEKSSPLCEVADTVARGAPFVPVISDLRRLQEPVFRNPPLAPLRVMTVELVNVAVVNLERLVPLSASRITSAVAPWQGPGELETQTDLEEVASAEVSWYSASALSQSYEQG
jgi:hypothetical protein